MKPTILTVDDDPIILDMYQAVLDQEYQLFTALSGQEALDILKTHPRVDIILSDIMMPGMDGYETCRRIRQNPSFAHIKVILVSSKMRLDDRLSGYQVGADDYITKPFEASELLAKVQVFLRLKNAEEIDQIKNNFISLVNHEARTPLTAIFGYAELLQQSPGLSAQDQSFVAKILESANELLRSSEKTVLLSNLKSGNVTLRECDIDLQRLLAKRLRKFHDSAAAKQVSLELRCGAAPRICGDLKLLATAIDALIENAVKFARNQTPVQVTAGNHQGQVDIEVANHGEKIAPAHLESIFDELAARDIEHHQKGHCMSLAIARRIAEAHGGSLAARNETDGPVFTLSVKI